MPVNINVPLKFPMAFVSSADKFGTSSPSSSTLESTFPALSNAYAPICERRGKLPVKITVPWKLWNVESLIADNFGTSSPSSSTLESAFPALFLHPLLSVLSNARCPICERRGKLPLKVNVPLISSKAPCSTLVKYASPFAITMSPS